MEYKVPNVIKSFLKKKCKFGGLNSFDFKLITKIKKSRQSGFWHKDINIGDSLALQGLGLDSFTAGVRFSPRSEN